MFCAKGKQEALQGVINLCTNQSRNNSYSNYHFQVILLFLPALWITTIIITIIIFSINSELYQLCNLSHLLYTFIIIILIHSHDFYTPVKWISWVLFSLIWKEKRITLGIGPDSWCNYKNLILEIILMIEIIEQRLFTVPDAFGLLGSWKSPCLGDGKMFIQNEAHMLSYLIHLPFIYMIVLE